MTYFHSDKVHLGFTRRATKEELAALLKEITQESTVVRNQGEEAETSMMTSVEPDDQTVAEHEGVSLWCNPTLIMYPL